MHRQAAVVAMVALFVWLLSHNACNPAETNPAAEPLYRNHGDSAEYVGIEACKPCHADKYETFVHTGMGHSFGQAGRKRSDADFAGNKPVYDRFANLWYYPHLRGDSLYLTEYRLQGNDTLHSRTEKIEYIIGSGHHTNSHLWQHNGYLYQAPLTFYTQSRIWDLPPGFENGKNSRFDRQIGYECIACHNALPNYESGSENRFGSMPQGISCERCHGPGSLHVNEKRKGIKVDVKNGIDRTIVNPAKLTWQQQADLCQRCHLQGNTVLQPGKDWHHFRPGMRLSDFIEVFMPRNETFIMAGHAQRLQQSRCFTASKNQGGLTCIRCHNPHISVRNTAAASFNKVCESCHQQNKCTETVVRQDAAGNNCTQCHMPRSGSADIPHVAVTDHRIRRKPGAEKLAETAFAGLQCINNPAAGPRSKAVAYMNSFEQSHNTQHTLDSALFYLNQLPATEDKKTLLVRYHFLAGNYRRNLPAAAAPSQPDAWTCYRLAESFAASARLEEAMVWSRKAVTLAPAHLAFRLKLSAFLITAGKCDTAAIVLAETLKLNSKQPQCYNQLAYVAKMKHMPQECEKNALMALRLNPDYREALINLAWAQHERGSSGLAATLKRLQNLK